MPEGVVVRGQGGLYYVQLPDRIVQCSARGKIKKGMGELLVGDIVVVNELSEDEGVVETIAPRKNKLVRPAIANVDNVLTVFSVNSPDPIPLLIDKFLVVITSAGVEPIIVFTKSDLADGVGSALVNVYQAAGYRVFLTSSKTGEGIDILKSFLSNRVSVFSGPSGVGKSALLNRLQTGLTLQTGQISDKIRRGRHTTRHASLLPLEDGGWVADTPGFSVLDLTTVKKEALQLYFPEFRPHIEKCRFQGCFHRAEPGCAVKDAVACGDVDKQRYGNYLSLLSEIEALPPEWARKSET